MAHDPYATMDSMKTSFHTDITNTILFKDWQTATTAELAGACVVVFILGIFSEALKLVRQYLLPKPPTKIGCRKCREGEEPLPPVDEKKEVIWCFSRVHLVQTFLYGLQSILSYMVMFVVMTLNVWLFMSVIAGFVLGYMLFGWKTVKDVEESHC